MNTNKKILVGVVMAIPLGIFFWTIHQTAIDFFYADDFHLFKTMVWTQEATSWNEVFKLFIQQHNEHRIVVPRLITLIDYWIEGHVNFRTLIFLGNLSWAGVAYLLLKRLSLLQLPFQYFLPVPFLLFQPQFSDNITWAISGLQQTVIVFWALLIIHLLSQQIRFKLVCILTIIATFTHGNGMFIFGVGLCLLLLQKNWKYLISWTLLMVIVASFYFWNYQAGQNSNLAESLSNPIRLVSGFFAFFGSATVVFSPNPNWAILLGFFLFILMSWLIIKPLVFYYRGKKIDNNELFFLGIYLFLCITAALVSLSRSWGGIENILMTRYAHYSPLTISLVYLLVCRPLIIHRLGRNVYIPVLLLSVFFCSVSYLKFTPDLINRKNTLLTDAYNWKHHQLMLSYAKSFNDNIKGVVQKAEKRGILNNEVLIEEAMKSPHVPLDTTIQLIIRPFSVFEQDASGKYERKYFSLENDRLTPTNFLVLQANQQTYLCPVLQTFASKRKILTDGKWFTKGFKANLLTESLEKSNYRISVLHLTEGKNQVIALDQFVDLSQ